MSTMLGINLYSQGGANALHITMEILSRLINLRQVAPMHQLAIKLASLPKLTK